MGFYTITVSLEGNRVYTYDLGWGEGPIQLLQAKMGRGVYNIGVS